MITLNKIKLLVFFLLFFPHILYIPPFFLFGCLFLRPHISLLLFDLTQLIQSANYIRKFRLNRFHPPKLVETWDPVINGSLLGPVSYLVYLLRTVSALISFGSHCIYLYGGQHLVRICNIKTLSTYSCGSLQIRFYVQTYPISAFELFSF